MSIARDSFRINGNSTPGLAAPRVSQVNRDDTSDHVIRVEGHVTWYTGSARCRLHLLLQVIRLSLAWSVLSSMRNSKRNNINIL